jgi:hypothetical protein
VGKHFVLDDGRVLVDEDIFYGKRGDFGEEDAAEGVGDGGVEAGEGKFGVVGGVLVELDVKGLEMLVWILVEYIRELVWAPVSVAYLLEVVQVPLMVLTGPVTGEVCRLLVGDCFGANTQRLAVGLAEFRLHTLSRVSTLRLMSSSAAGVDIVAALSSRCVFPVGGALSMFTKSSRKAPTAKADAANGGRLNLVASSM